MTKYTCPMHPEIIRDLPGDCPICGMALELVSGQAEGDDPELKSMTLRFWVSAVLTIPLLFLAMGYHGGLSDEDSRWLQLFLSFPVVAWAGFPFFVRGWRSLVNMSLNMFTLIALGVGVAFLYSCAVLIFPDFFPSLISHQGELPLYFESASVITVLVLAGQVMELKARAKTGSAIRALLGKGAKNASVVRNGVEVVVAIDEVVIDDVIRIKPGEIIPVDGVVIEGGSTIDMSMISGESMPIEITIGSKVVGGTINIDGSFLMKAEKVGKDTFLARIVERVLEAQRSRAPIQAVADTAASYFVPAVVIISILTFICWALWGPSPSLILALVNAVAVLIIACPCALGLATPMSIMVGMGRGSEEGILIKNAEALEKLEKVKTVVVDKTGTLTEGKPVVTQIVVIGKYSEDEVLRWAAAVEEASEHPLAHCIVQEAKKRNLKIPRVDEFKMYSGEGVTGKVEGVEVGVGKESFVLKRNIKGMDLLQQRASRYFQSAQTILYIFVQGQAVGLIGVSDTLKATTFEAVEQLHRLGLKVIILSGDNIKTVEVIAKKLNIDEFHGSIGPEDKHTFILERKGKEGFIAMAGDGVNDAAALAEADVGIAMGTGTDVAIESAAVTLVKGDLRGIVNAIELSRDVMKNIRQNLFFAFIYNIVGITIATGMFYPFTGWVLNPMIAAFAMSLSSVSVIGNALRLRKAAISKTI